VAEPPCCDWITMSLCPCVTMSPCHYVTVPLHYCAEEHVHHCRLQAQARSRRSSRASDPLGEAGPRHTPGAGPSARRPVPRRLAPSRGQ